MVSRHRRDACNDDLPPPQRTDGNRAAFCRSVPMIFRRCHLNNIPLLRQPLRQNDPSPEALGLWFREDYPSPQYALPTLVISKMVPAPLETTLVSLSQANTPFSPRRRSSTSNPYSSFYSSRSAHRPTSMPCFPGSWTGTKRTTWLDRSGNAQGLASG